MTAVVQGIRAISFVPSRGEHLLSINLAFVNPWSDLLEPGYTLGNNDCLQYRNALHAQFCHQPGWHHSGQSDGYTVPPPEP